MTARLPVVVVGGGHAGFAVATALRNLDRDVPLVIVDAEPRLPYQRPPLSKAFMRGHLTQEELAFRPESFYTDSRIQLITGNAVRAVHRSSREVELADGTAVPYSSLVLATGSRHRDLMIPGRDLDRVFGLRSFDDAIRLRSLLADVRRVSIVGGGFIGLEFASVAAHEGKSVTLFEAQPRLMARSVTELISDYFLRAHRDAGVDVRLCAAVDAIEGSDHVEFIIPTASQPVATDLVVVGIGASAADELAAEAGLATADGVVVDDFLRTSDPLIYAIGDCARFPTPLSSAPTVRLEAIQNATDQARHVAASIIGGLTGPYAAVPWFWTEQCEAKLQIAGLSKGYDHVEVVGGASSFSIYAFADGGLLSCESVNAPRDHLRARRALGGDEAARAGIEAAIAGGG
jgi:3-phenylpropionate/trans-cinnamate dioxygenase ferredoxin reductase subunit